MALSDTELKQCLGELVNEDSETVNAEPLTRTQWHALFRGLDNWFEANRLAAKAAMEAEAGITVTNATAKKVGRYWLRKKWGGE